MRVQNRLCCVSTVLFIFFIVWLQPSIAISQTKEHGNILVTSGGSAQFFITTLSNYTEVITGKTLLQPTQLRIEIVNKIPPDGNPDWRLVVSASDDKIYSFDDPSEFILLNSLELNISATAGYDAINPLFNPSETGVVMLSGSADGSGVPVVIFITINYTLTGNMNIKPQGLYYVGLNFELWTKKTTETW